jgi:hypothetical protein
MRDKSLEQDDARGRDERWKDSHQSMIAERKEALVREDGMTPRDAERRATQLQELATKRARARAEGRG